MTSQRRREGAGGGRVEEAELIALAKAGDQAAFETIYRQNVAQVHGFLRVRVGQTLADDLAAETFVAAWRGLGGYEDRGTPIRAWLMRIAYRQILAHARRRSSSEVVSSELDVGSVAPVEDEALGSVQAAELRTLLRHLPPAQSSALNLRYLRDFSVAETAAVLDTTEEAVRALTYRALATLRKLREGSDG